MGRVEEAAQGGLCRCEPRDKRQSLWNGIMASCLNVSQNVCQVTASLNVFILESDADRMRKQEQQRALVQFTRVII